MTADCREFLLMFQSLPVPLQELVLKRCSVRNMILHGPPELHSSVLSAHLLDNCRLNLCGTLKTPGAPPALRNGAGRRAAPQPPPLMLKIIAPLFHNLPALTHLTLAANALSASAAPILAEHLPSLPGLSHLDLSVNRLAHGVVELAPALSRTTALRLLDLGSNELPPEAYCALAAHLAGHPALRHLALGGNKLCARGATALGDLLRTPLPLQQLLLPRVPCPVGPAAAWLCGGLAGASRLGVLRLPQCGLDAPAAAALAEALPGLRSLRVLDLALNSFTPTSVAALAGGLRDLPALLHLDLGWSNLGDMGAAAALAGTLRDAPFRTCLQSLLLSNCHLRSDIAVTAGLLAALGHPNPGAVELEPEAADFGAIGGLTALTELNLSHNPLKRGDAALAALVSTLGPVTALASLSLDNVGAGDEFMAAFAARALPGLHYLETMTVAKNAFGAPGAAAVRRQRPRKLMYVHWDWQKPEYGSDTTETPPESEDEEPPKPPRLSDV